MKLSTHCYTALLLLGFGITTASAQSAYSMHILEAGETLSMLAKSYHTTVGDIMRMNGMNAQSQLQIGEKIKIPASTVVVPAQPVKATSTAPVRHSSICQDTCGGYGRNIVPNQPDV